MIERVKQVFFKSPINGLKIVFLLICVGGLVALFVTIINLISGGFSSFAYIGISVVLLAGILAIFLGYSIFSLE